MIEIKKKKVCVALLLFLLGWYMLSMFGNNWLESDYENLGLWKTCGGANSGCVWLEQSPSYLTPFLDWFSAVRAFLILSCVFVVLAIVMMLCHIYDGVHFKVKPARILSIFCVIFLILAISVFASERRLEFDSSWKLGWTFYITCVGLLFTILVNIYLFNIKDTVVKKYSPVQNRYKQHGAGKTLIRESITGPVYNHRNEINVRDDWNNISEDFGSVSEHIKCLPTNATNQNLATDTTRKIGNTGNNTSRIPIIQEDNAYSSEEESLLSTASETSYM